MNTTNGFSQSDGVIKPEDFSIITNITKMEVEPLSIDSPVVGDNDYSFHQIIDVLNPGDTSELIKKWTDVARGLGTKEETIATERTSLLIGTIHIADVYMAILTEWRSTRGSEATLHELESILRKRGLDVAASRLRQEYCDLFFPLSSKIRKQKHIRIISAAIIAIVAIAVVTSTAVALVFAFTCPIRNDTQPEYNNTVPVLPSDYIRRELKYRGDLSTRLIFNSKIEDNVLVFSDIDEYQVQELVKFGTTTSITTTLHDNTISNRYITGLLLVSEFQKLCELSDDLSIHWLQYNATKESFKWMQSCGPTITFIQNAVNLSSATLEENRFAHLPYFSYNIHTNNDQNSSKSTSSFINQPIIIYGPSGTGKSSLLAAIANAIQTTHQNAIVVFATFAPFLEAVTKQQNQSVGLREAVLSIVVNTACSDSTCQNNLKTEIRNETVKLVIMLDAFDRLYVAEVSKGYHVLREIRTWNSTLLFVTTRPNYLTKLEHHLSTMAYRLEPYSEEKQKEYLVNYWHKNRSHLNRDRLHNYSVACITAIKSRHFNNGHDFTGVALLTNFIAEVYEANATAYADPSNVAAGGGPRIEFTSVYQLYETVVSKRLDGFTNDSSRRNELELIHAYVAIRSMFPYEKIEFHLNETTVADLEDIGLVERGSGDSGRLMIIHATFVDYFVAWYTLNCNLNLTLCRSMFDKLTTVVKSDNVYDWRCRYTAYNFRYELVAYFVDASPSLTNIAQSSVSFNISNAMLLASLHDDYFGLFSVFANRSLQYVGQNVHKEVVFHSVAYSSLPLVKHALDYIPANVTTSLQNVTLESCPRLNALHLSAIRGRYDIFNYMWSKFTHSHPEIFQGLVHNAVAEPLHEKVNSQIVVGKISILRFLIRSIGREVLEELDYLDRCTPLFSTYSKDIVLELISQGADGQIICPRSGTLLHFVSTYMSQTTTEQDYQEVMVAMQNKLLLTPRIVNHKHQMFFSEPTPLENYISAFEPTMETLEMFKQSRANFSAIVERRRSNEKYSLFMVAIVLGRSPKSLNLLSQYVTNWQIPDDQNVTALTVAIKYNHLTAARLILSEYPDLIYIADRNGSYPLQTLFEGDDSLYRDNRAMTRLLVQYGSDVNQVTGDELVTPFLMAVERSDLATVKYMVNHGARLDSTDSINNTALHYVLSQFEKPPQHRYDIVKYLVGNLQLSVNAQNALNRTALESGINYFLANGLDLYTLQYLVNNGAVISSRFGDQILGTIFTCILEFSRDITAFRETASRVVEAGGNLTYRFSDGGTFLHHSVQYLCLNGVLYLVEKGLDVNAKNDRDRTPLSYIRAQSTDPDAKAISSTLKQHGAHVKM